MFDLNKLGKKEKKIYNKYHKFLNELQKNSEKININDIKVFYINGYNEDIINNLPQKIEILIIDSYDIDKAGKITNLPYYLKKIIIKDVIINSKTTLFFGYLNSIEKLELYTKIPFATEIIFFEKEYISDASKNRDEAFYNFIVNEQKINKNTIYTSFKHQDIIYYRKVSTKKRSNNISFNLSQKFKYVKQEFNYIKMLRLFNFV